MLANDTFVCIIVCLCECLITCIIQPFFFSLQDLSEEACNSSLRELTFLLANQMGRRAKSASSQQSLSCAELQAAARFDLSRVEIPKVPPGLNRVYSLEATESVSVQCDKTPAEVDDKEEWQVRQSVVISKEALRNAEKRSKILCVCCHFALGVCTTVNK